MVQKLADLLKVILSFYDSRPKLTTVLVVLVTMLFAYLIFTSCTVTLSVQKNNNNSSISSESKTTAESSVDSTYINFKAQQ